MAEFGKWIPIKWREATEEEKEFFKSKYGGEVNYMADFETPDDGDEILISRNNGRWISLVTFTDDDFGISDEDGNNWLTDVDAWMPLPEGYGKEKNG